MRFGGKGVRLLASEIWAIRNEIEMWNGFPESYSYCVVCGFLSLSMCGLEDFSIWVVANSPRFGVVIDLAMAGHIVLLVRLCLKAVVREAFRLVYGLMNNESKQKGWSGRRFCCPVLGQVMMWLTSQLAILYGEGNGKSFTISMLKHCLSGGSLSSSFFSVKNEANQSEDLKVAGIDCEKPFTVNGESVGKCSAAGIISDSVVFVSQVAAAIAALHERQMLEEKIRALWDSRLPSTYQRILEHENICRTSDIERQKRPNYRPLIEYDGIFRQQSHGQDSNKTKTREEILAEERDYKRRRISYRGKKSKRSTTEVMRDIIEFHMEELKHARETECSVKSIEAKQDLECITYTGHENSISDCQQTRSSEFSSKLGRGQQRNFGELSGSHSKAVAESAYEVLDNKQHRQTSNSHLHQELDGSTMIDRTKRERYTRRLEDQISRRQERDHSVSPYRRRSRYERRDSPRSPNKQRRKYKRENISSSPDGQSSKYNKNYSSRSPDRKLSSHHRHVSDEQIQDEKLINGISSHVSEKGYRKTSERNSRQKQDREHKLEVQNKSRGKTHHRHKSTSESYDRYSSCVESNKFEDRYDPSESYGD
ncbi:hypothetical protein LIER_30301 [Lithospermum erythrorhizon]|uniref:Uncharacterized protein n=1 Tax=Lithospermum erythrorhizon TaxID=34254 RepID=A0AAV3RSE1_LITER